MKTQITLQQATILLGEIAYHGTIKRIDNGFSFDTDASFTGEVFETFISDAQIRMCLKSYGSVYNEGAQIEARDCVLENGHYNNYLK